MEALFYCVLFPPVVMGMTGFRRGRCVILLRVHI